MFGLSKFKWIFYFKFNFILLSCFRGRFTRNIFNTVSLKTCTWWFIKFQSISILYFYSAHWCYWNIYAYVAHGTAHSGHHHAIKRVTETYTLVPGLFLVGWRKILRAFIRTHDNRHTHDLLYILRLWYELCICCTACMRFAGNREVRKFINPRND